MAPKKQFLQQVKQNVFSFWFWKFCQRRWRGGQGNSSSQLIYELSKVWKYVSMAQRHFKLREGEGRRRIQVLVKQAPRYHERRSRQWGGRRSAGEQRRRRESQSILMKRTLWRNPLTLPLSVTISSSTAFCSGVSFSPISSFSSLINIFLLALHLLFSSGEEREREGKGEEHHLGHCPWHRPLALLHRLHLHLREHRPLSPSDGPPRWDDLQQPQGPDVCPRWRQRGRGGGPGAAGGHCGGLRQVGEWEKGGREKTNSAVSVRTMRWVF